VVGVDALGSHLRGGPERIDPRETVADGLRVREAGRLTRALCRDGLDGVITVTEGEVRDTMVSLANEERLVVEGAGAVAVAGLSRLSGHKRVAVISGGNVDLELLAELVTEQTARRLL
ncbi:MAG: pyridoxal-phosphate dependent enzyme, partial [Myxococcota bacterium]|nr:pyridoxal-phosphate dependent enzyme [Myxococcota bacterium]